MKIKNILKPKEKQYKGTAVIAGNKGEVGSAIQKLLINGGFKTYGIDKKDKKKVLPKKGETVDFLHICIPFKTQKQFDEDTTALIKKINPKNVIIHSSVLPGTTTELFEKSESSESICYSPIRGQHDSLINDIKRYEKYFSPLPRGSAETFSKHLQEMGLKASGHMKSPEELELVKLLDVCQYGILIGWAQECQRALKAIPAGYSLLQQFQAEHVEFYPEKRADITPGLAGGHCVVQDAELVAKVFKSNMLKAFLASNKKKRDEL